MDNNINNSDFELMSYIDLAYMVLKKDGLSYKTAQLFKIVCDLLEYTDSQYEDKIGYFYTEINLDKRFVLVKGFWDIRDRQKIVVNLDEEEEIDCDFNEDIDDDVDLEDDLDEESSDEKKFEDFSSEESSSDDFEDYDSVDTDKNDLDDELDLDEEVPSEIVSEFGGLTIVDEEDTEVDNE